MTGFGSAERNGCRVEIRSLNQRFLDVYVKAPPFLNRYEPDFRSALRSRFSRGKIDVTITLSGEAAAGMTINAAAAGRIFSALGALQKELGIPGAIEMNSLLLFHERFMEADACFDGEAVKAVFGEALESLSEMRDREGRLLAGELVRLADGLAAMNLQVRSRIEKVLPELALKLQDKLKTLLGSAELDPVRMQQEVALLAGRSDITEETARLDCHIVQFKELLHGAVAGRKLDFLVQEFHREVNTMSSKSLDYDISRLAVDMKTEIERMREQVQNLQ